MLNIKKFIISNIHSIRKFITVGTITAIFYISFFIFLHRILNVHYNIAVSLAYSASIVLYFFATRHFTFQSHLNPLKGQVLRFSMLIVLNYFITLIIVHTTVKFLLLPPVLGVVFAIGITTASNYLLGKFWVFPSSIILQNGEKN
jgi:putative flippase GtrA